LIRQLILEVGLPVVIVLGTMIRVPGIDVSSGASGHDILDVDSESGGGASSSDAADSTRLARRRLP
jgi:hypothetical protein